jgi:hypothetical protein
MQILDKIKNILKKPKVDEAPSPMLIPTVTTYPTNYKTKRGKSATLNMEKVKEELRVSEDKKLEEAKKKVFFDTRISQVSKIPKDELNGRKNLLINLKSYIADVQMREMCMGCDYRHHIMTKEERKQVVDMLNRISMLHSASGSKRIFREYKIFNEIECICLAKKCPYGYFHGDVIGKDD